MSVIVTVTSRDTTTSLLQFSTLNLVNHECCNLEPRYLSPRYAK